MKSHAVALTLLGLLSSQNSERTPSSGNGIIVGVVVNERQEPVARAMVQAFSASVTLSPDVVREAAPPIRRASGSATTDQNGGFRISGLALGEYVIAPAPLPSFPSGGPLPAAIYAETFYPSAIDDRQAARVSASGDPAAPIRIELVRVRGARVSGSVVNPSGRKTEGMRVRLYHQFGNVGGESDVAVVDANATFEIPRVPPGWYRLSIAPRGPESPDPKSEFAERLIEVKDHDVEGLALVLGPGASITGHVAVEGAASVTSGVGLRVSAVPTPQQYSASGPISATVAADWAFHLNGPSGLYQFAVARDRAPFVTVTQVSVDGLETSARDGVELVEGTHDVVVFVSPREAPRPPSSGHLHQPRWSSSSRVRDFLAAGRDCKADRRASRAECAPVPAGRLSHQDRHLRGNAALIFAGLGDPRGLQVIADIITDRSDCPEGQGIPGVSGDGRYHVARQIAADRYYAAHLLGDLRRSPRRSDSRPAAQGSRGQLNRAMVTGGDRRQARNRSAD